MKAKSLLLLTALPLFACSTKERPFVATGVFEATEVLLSSEVPGKLLSLAHEEGDRVSAGEVLGEIDCRQLSLQRAQLAASAEALRVRKIDIPLQLAVIRQQLAAAKHEQARVAQLMANGAATSKQVDDIDAQVRLLERQLAAASSTHKSANQGLDEEGRSLSHRLEQLDDQLARCSITSPISGTILAKYAEAGEVATLGRPLYKLADMERLFLRAYITSEQLQQLRLGQEVPVEADFGTAENRPYRGTIAWIADRAEFTPRSIQTQDERANLVYAVKIAVKNDGYLKLGMYGLIPAAPTSDEAR